MAIFQDLFASTRRHKGEQNSRSQSRAPGPETLPVKMNLEERMAFRRELLFETIRATLSSHFIEPNSYRFKIMRTDRRGHCYVVMLDMTASFMTSEQGQHARLSETAAALTSNAMGRYGLVIGGVYWRIDDTLGTSADNRTRAPAAVPAPSAGLPPRDAVSANIEKYQRATAEQLAEFEAAWQKDADIQIGDRTYSSDLAPLGDDSRPG